MDMKIRKVRCTGWGLMALVVIGVCGCGGKSSRHERPIRAASDEEEFSDKKPATQVAPVAKPAQAAAGNAVASPAPAKPIVPKRSDDFETWKLADYRNAKAENDPRLIEAILHLGKNTSDDDEAAQLLISFIQASSSSSRTAGAMPGTRGPLLDNKGDEIFVDEQDLKPGARPAGGKIANLGEAVVTALADNGSPRAVDALKQILAGNFETDQDEKTLVRATIRALSENSRSEYADIMYTMLTAPEELRPEPVGGVDAEALQKECFFVSGKTLSQAVRAALARHVAKAGIPTAHRDLLLPYLLKPEVDNLDAQVVLYAHDAIGDVQAPVQKIWADLAPRVIDRFLDVSRERVPLGKEMNLGQEDLVRVAQALWSAECANAVKAQLSAEQEDLQKHTEMLKVAASLPSPIVRAALHDTISQHWLKWSKWFDDKKFDMKSIRDPGLLLVVRTMPREEDPERRRVKGPNAEAVKLDEDGKPINPKAAKASKLKDEQEKKRRIDAKEQERRDKRAARYTWNAVMEKLLKASNQRFHAAALARAKMASVEKRTAAAEVGGSLRDKLLPFDLHEGAEVTAWYKLSWPDDLQSSFGEVAVPPLQVRYVRLELQDSFGRMLRHYKEQLESPQEFVIERGKWLESQKIDADAGWMRSIDVQISREAEMPPTARDASESLLIEILVVEAPNPTSGATRDRVALQRTE